VHSQTFDITIAPSSGSTQLVAGSNLQLVGGFRVPSGVIDGKNTRYLSGSFDYQNGKWVANHGVSEYIVEYFEPGAMGTGDPLLWPELTIGRHGTPMLHDNKLAPEGVLWVNSDQVLCSARLHYRSGYRDNWVTIYDLSDGSETLIPLYDPSLGDGSVNDSENLHQMLAFGTGFCRIPEVYANANTNGRTIGLGRGGYDVLDSPQGPALAAFQLGDSKIEQVLIDHPYQTNQAPRDHDYWYPEYDGTTTEHSWVPGLLDNETPAHWQAGECSTPGWIEHSSFRGVIYCACQAAGTMDYNAQGDSGSGRFFSVSDPVLFYSANSNGNRGNHQAQTQFQGSEPATYKRVAYVYDPNNLAAAPVRFDFPLGDFVLSEDSKNPSMVDGVFWDNERQLLWVCITNIHINQKYAVLAAYELGGA